MEVARGSDLIGLPVLVEPKLMRIGRVQEILISRDGAHICGLVLDDGGWLQPRRVLDYRAVKAVGETHLLADELYLSDESQARCCRELQGLPVLRTSGEEVGVMDDVHFEPESGRVTALQLSHGFVDDLLMGKEIMLLTGPVTTGQAAILLGGPEDLSGGAGS